MNTIITILLLQCITVLPNFSDTLLSPLIPTIEQSLQISIHMAEWLFTTYTLGQAAGVFIWGIVRDKYSTLNVLYTGLAIYIFSSIFCLLTKNIYFLYALRFVQGFSVAACSIVSLVLVRHIFQNDIYRLRIYSKISMAYAVSPTLGSLVGTLFISIKYWQHVFLIFCTIAFVLICWARISLPPYNHPVTNPHETTSMAPLKDKHFVIHSVILALAISNVKTFYTLAAHYYTQFFHMNPEMLYIIYIPISCAFIAGGYASQKLIKFLSTTQGLCVGGVTAFSAALIPLLIIKAFGYAEYYTLVISLGGVFFMLTGTGIIIPRCMTVCLNRYSHNSGTASAIMYLIYYTICALVTYTAAYMPQENHDYYHQFFSALNLILLAAVYLAYLTRQDADNLS